MRKTLLALTALALISPALAGCAGTPPPLTAMGPAQVSAPAEQVRLIEARVAANNRGDWAAWQALHTADCIRTAPDLKAPLASSAEMRAAIERLTHAFPDYHLTLVRVTGAGDWAAAEFIATGSMSRAMPNPGGLPIPPTFRTFQQNWVALIRFDGRRIAEVHEFYDRKDLSDQMMGFGAPRLWMGTRHAATDAR